jgi:nucleotide-binding universal stress UspA family protein
LFIIRQTNKSVKLAEKEVLCNIPPDIMYDKKINKIRWLKMYKKILVPLDGSTLSEASLEHVKSIISRNNPPEIILLRVVEPISSFDASGLAQSGYLLGDVQKRKMADAAEYLAKITAILDKENIKTQQVIAEGRAAEAIMDYVEKNHVDLIIMSSHGRTGISRWAFGSVADRILHQSKVPVLLVTVSGARTG